MSGTKWNGIFGRGHFSGPVFGLIASTFAMLAGCESVSHDHSATTRPAVATDIDPARADPDFWLNQKPALSVGDPSFDVLWHAAEHVSQDYLFDIDRRDRRLGLLTTVPTVSAQWFEPWRRELQSTSDVVDSSTATLRRTIFWQFRPVSNGYAVTPKVLIERMVLTEERVSGLLSRAYLRRLPDNDTYGSRELDDNVKLPDTYWYPVGRDFAFEQRLQSKMLAKLDEYREQMKPN